MLQSLADQPFSLKTTNAWMFRAVGSKPWFCTKIYDSRSPRSDGRARCDQSKLVSTTQIICEMLSWRLVECDMCDILKPWSLWHKIRHAWVCMCTIFSCQPENFWCAVAVAAWPSSNGRRCDLPFSVVKAVWPGGVVRRRLWLLLVPSWGVSAHSLLRVYIYI